MKITIEDLKQELMETIHKIDKEKITVFDIKTISETVSIISTIKENQTEYFETLMETFKSSSTAKPPTVSELKGDD